MSLSQLIRTALYIDNFKKMPQLNRKYPSGAPKRRKKKGMIKAYEKCKGVLDRFVIVAGLTGDW